MTRPTLGPFLLVVGSAWPAALMTIGGVTLSGDRLLGLAAIPVALALGLRRALHWTTAHTALAVFVIAQIVTTTLNADVWPRGLRFVPVYVLGFACFALAAEWTRGADGRRRMVIALLTVAVVVSLAGMIEAHLSNIYQQQWGTGIVQIIHPRTAQMRLLFAPKVTFGEWNLYSSFLLIPLAVGLWTWRRTGGPWLVVGAVGVILFGLVTGVTRSVLAGMVGVVVAWCALARPRVRQVAAVVAMLAAAVLVQIQVCGAESIKRRFFQVSTVVSRIDLNRISFESWLKRPLVGHGAGSTNNLELPPHIRVRIHGKTWAGNMLLFVLHDSGIVGMAALAGFAVVLARRTRRALRADGGGRALVVPVATAGVALVFAYQFTHGLWTMYPYVCAGFLTAITATGSDDA